MVIYRVEWYDQHEGRCYEWATTKAAAYRRRKELDDEHPEIDHFVNRHVIPDTRAGMVDWLNKNFTTDNG